MHGTIYSKGYRDKPASGYLKREGFFERQFCKLRFGSVLNLNPDKHCLLRSSYSAGEIDLGVSSEKNVIDQLIQVYKIVQYSYIILTTSHLVFIKIRHK